jgi:hypothetical protein
LPPNAYSNPNSNSDVHRNGHTDGNLHTDQYASSSNRDSDKYSDRYRLRNFDPNPDGYHPAGDRDSDQHPYSDPA